MNVTCEGIRSCCQAHLPFLCSDEGNTDHVMTSLTFLVASVILCKIIERGNELKLKEICVNKIKNVWGFDASTMLNLGPRNKSLGYTDESWSFLVEQQRELSR